MIALCVDGREWCIGVCTHWLPHGWYLRYAPDIYGYYYDRYWVKSWDKPEGGLVPDPTEQWENMRWVCPD